MMIDKQKLLDILTSEIESSTGCTDPGSVCLRWPWRLIPWGAGRKKSTCW